MSDSIHPTAIVDSTARIAPTASVGKRAVIASNVSVGHGASIGANAVVHSDARIENAARVGEGATICQGVTVGADVRIPPGRCVAESIRHPGATPDAVGENAREAAPSSGLASEKRFNELESQLHAEAMNNLPKDLKHRAGDIPHDLIDEAADNYRDLLAARFTETRARRIEAAKAARAWAKGKGR